MKTNRAKKIKNIRYARIWQPKCTNCSSKNIFQRFLIIPAFLILLFFPGKLAQADHSVLPHGINTYDGCEEMFNPAGATDEQRKARDKEIKKIIQEDADSRDDFLACAIITGRVSLYMIPYFIVYLIQVLVQLSAILCVLFIVIGGLIYAISGITDQKEKAKKTVFNAVIGLVITAMAWLVINIIQVAVTSGGQ